MAEGTEAIYAPLSVASGFAPNWARDQLMNIMSPYWVYITKSEETLGLPAEEATGGWGK